MIRLAVAIKAVPSRLPFVQKYMIPKLTEYQLMVDAKLIGTWPHSRAILTAYAEATEYTHVLLLEDDLLLCEDFTAGVAFATVHNPESIFTLFTGFNPANRRHRRSWAWWFEALRLGVSWARIGSWVQGPAVVFPIPLITPFLEFCRDYELPQAAEYWAKIGRRDKNPVREFYDNRVSLFMQKYLKKPVYTTVPSLCQHVGGEFTTLSINTFDVSPYFIGEKASALSIDWERGKPVY